MLARRVHLALGIALATLAGALAANGCAATNAPDTFGKGGAGGAVFQGTGGHAGAHQGGGGAAGHHTTGPGTGGGIIKMDGGEDGPAPDVFVNPCGSKCGPTELCDPAHLGLDDNCNGLVDEGCACMQGQAHWCFKGDPSYHHTPGCYDGTEYCSEFGVWGPCLGGVHATDGCFADNTKACHAITSPPFATVHLETGTGNFSANEVTQTFMVACPMGVAPCPGVMGTDSFTPLQSGQYDITYSKTIADGGVETCTFPLIVGAPGLRVELQWEHDLGGPGDMGVDLDLHMHQPMDTGPWNVDTGATNECMWNNCVEIDFDPPPVMPPAPSWFLGPPAKPPMPVNWFLDPVMANNTCYFAPRGVGAQWQTLGMGCHNPRLDLDNITCDPTILDVNDMSFCAPENINVDYPPEKQWTRIGVHYYGNHGETYDVHPDVKIYCDGALAADLGSAGYYTPQSPVTFTPADGTNVGMNRFWIVADVAFVNDKCGNKGCVVQPVYANAATKTPFLTLDGAATTVFAPVYPPIPP